MPKKDRAATRTTPGFTGPFKGNPQQGTLFDVRTVPKDPTAIGPRGYALERSRQFQIVFGGRLSAGNAWPEQHPFGPVSGGKKGVSFTEGGPGTEYRSMQRGRSKMIDALARSTVRPEDLKGLTRIELTHDNIRASGMYHPTSSSGIGSITLSSTSRSRGAGEANQESPPPWVKHPEQRGPVDPDSEVTLMHELGHHRSDLAGNESLRQYGRGNTQAIEEARADRHAIETFREDPRSRRWTHPLDPRTHTYGANKFFEGTPQEPVYNRFLGQGNEPPPKYESSTLKTEAVRERRLRPMLDEPHFQGKEYPLDEHDESIPNRSPFSPTNVPGWTDRHEPETAQREAVYMKAVQTRNMKTQVFRKEQQMKKERWGVTNRRQFSGYEEGVK